MKKHLQNILTFVVIFLIVNTVMGIFFKPNSEEANQNPIELSAIHKDFELGNTVSVDLKNNTQSNITLKNTCPNEPMKVLEKQNGQWIEKHKTAQISCDETGDIIVKPGEKHTISFANWNYALFNQTGMYKVQAVVWVDAPAQTTVATQQPTSLQTSQQANVQIVNSQQNTQQTQQTVETTASNTGIESKVLESNEFEIKPQGWFGWLWTAIFYQPIYNILIFLISIIPGHGLGLGIILLTLIIRTILLIPNQKALESQRRMQEVQPKLNHIREKYKDNQEMIGKETLAIMQQHKVNPAGSCLPMLIQFPVLIALYYVVQNGLNPDNAYLLYGSLQNFDYGKIDVMFFGLMNLTKINGFILPLIVGGLQFLQMKLAIFNNNKKKQPTETPKKSEMDAANGMMLYFMPVMIAIFTASVPAGVGIYWSTSTIYGIVQQLYVNAKADKEKVKVRVIEEMK